MPKISFQKGAIHLVIILLVLVGLAIFASVSIFANKNQEGRPLSDLSELLSISNNNKGPCYPIGDVTNNGRVKANDAKAILNYVAGLKPKGFFPNRADVNKDGNITAVDAQLI